MLFVSLCRSSMKREHQVFWWLRSLSYDYLLTQNITLIAAYSLYCLLVLTATCAGIDFCSLDHEDEDHCINQERNLPLWLGKIFGTTPLLMLCLCKWIKMEEVMCFDILLSVFLLFQHQPPM